MSITMQPTPDLRDAATDAAEALREVIAVHVYGEDDDVPDTCPLLATLNKLRAALGLEADDIGAKPVWQFAATFANAAGEPDRFETEVTAEDADAALVRGRRDLDTVRRGATKVDARVSRIAPPAPFTAAPPRLGASAPPPMPAAVTLAAAILEPLGFVAESIGGHDVVMVKRIMHPATKAVAGVILATDAKDSGKAPALTEKCGGWLLQRFAGDGTSGAALDRYGSRRGSSGDFLTATAQRMAADARRDAFGGGK